MCDCVTPQLHVTPAAPPACVHEEKEIKACLCDFNDKGFACQMIFLAANCCPAIELLRNSLLAKSVYSKQLNSLEFCSFNPYSSHLAGSGQRLALLRCAAYRWRRFTLPGCAL